MVQPVAGLKWLLHGTRLGTRFMVHMHFRRQVPPPPTAAAKIVPHWPEHDHTRDYLGMHPDFIICAKNAESNITRSK